MCGMLPESGSPPPSCHGTAYTAELTRLPASISCCRRRDRSQIEARLARRSPFSINRSARRDRRIGQSLRNGEREACLFECATWMNCPPGRPAVYFGSLRQAPMFVALSFVHSRRPSVVLPPGELRYRRFTHSDLDPASESVPVHLISKQRSRHLDPSGREGAHDDFRWNVMSEGSWPFSRVRRIPAPGQAVRPLTEEPTLDTHTRRVQ